MIALNSPALCPASQARDSWYNALATAYTSWYATKDKTKQVGTGAPFVAVETGRRARRQRRRRRQPGSGTGSSSAGVDALLAELPLSPPPYPMQTWDDAKRAAWNTWKVMKLYA